MSISLSFPYQASQQQAERVYSTLLNEMQGARTIYLGGTNAVGEAGFMCSLFPSLVLVDDYKAGVELFGRRVISTEEMARQARPHDFLVNNCTSVAGFNHFSRQADSLGIPMCSIVEALAPHYSSGVVMKFAGMSAVYGPAFHQHTFQNLEKYAKLRARFKDKLSLRTFDDLINYRLTGDPSLLCRVAVGHQFGTIQHDSYVLNSQFFSLSDHEVFIDAGALDGATSEHFIRSVKGDFERIVMFEPAAESAQKCHDLVNSLDQEFSGKKIKSKIDIVKSGLYGHNGELSLAMSLFDQDLTKLYGVLPQSAHILDTGLSSAFVKKGEEYNVIKVPVIKLDDYMGSDPATFIKFEIEGSEVSALQGATETILHNKPKMALSIYHRPQDLELIIDYVEGLEIDYKIALRAHNPYTPDAIVLYCWQ